MGAAADPAGPAGLRADKLYYCGREHHIITKSGGFGEENLLSELTEELKGK